MTSHTDYPHVTDELNNATRSAPQQALQKWEHRAAVEASRQPHQDNDTSECVTRDASAAGLLTGLPVAPLRTPHARAHAPASLVASSLLEASQTSRTWRSETTHGGDEMIEMPEPNATAPTQPNSPTARDAGRRTGAESVRRSGSIVHHHYTYTLSPPDRPRTTELWVGAPTWLCSLMCWVFTHALSLAPIDISHHYISWQGCDCRLEDWHAHLELTPTSGAVGKASQKNSTTAALQIKLRGLCNDLTAGQVSENCLGVVLTRCPYTYSTALARSIPVLTLITLGTIQRKLAWPPRMDDTHIRGVPFREKTFRTDEGRRADPDPRPAGTRRRNSFPKHAEHVHPHHVRFTRCRETSRRSDRILTFSPCTVRLSRDVWHTANWLALHHRMSWAVEGSAGGYA